MRSLTGRASAAPLREPRGGALHAPRHRRVVPLHHAIADTLVRQVGDRFAAREHRAAIVGCQISPGAKRALARAGEDDRAVVGGVHVVTEDPARVLALLRDEAVLAMGWNRCRKRRAF